MSIKAVKKNNKGILKIFVIGEIHTNKKYSHTNNFGHIYNNNNMLFRQQSIDSWWDGEYNIRNKYEKYEELYNNYCQPCQISSVYISLSMSIVSQLMNVLVPKVPKIQNHSLEIS